MNNPADQIISNLARAAIQHIDKEQAAFNYMNDTVDQIASNLVREGINKHRARELAVHFIKLINQGAVAPKVEPRTDESGVGFDSPPAPPAYPQTLSIADVDHANIPKPNTWTIEHFECWQREQVALENIRVLRRHIKELRQVMSPKLENDDMKQEPVTSGIIKIAMKQALDVLTWAWNNGWDDLPDPLQKKAIDSLTVAIKQIDRQQAGFYEMIEELEKLEQQACEIIRREPSGWASVENPSEYLDDLRGGADK